MTVRRHPAGPGPTEALAARPRLRGFEGRQVIVGIRPEDMEDAATQATTREGRRVLRAEVDLREALGSEVLVHFTVDAPAGADRGHPGACARRGRGRARGRAPRGPVAVRRPAQPADRGSASATDDRSGRGHQPDAFLRPRDGDGHLRRDRVNQRPEGGIDMERHRHVDEGADPGSPRSMLLASACSGGEDLRSDTNDSTSARAPPISSGRDRRGRRDLDRRRAGPFQMVLDEFAEQTGATVRFRSAGDDVAAYVGPRIEGGDPPDVAILPQPGVLQTFAAQGDLVAIEDVAGRRGRRELRRDRRATSARPTARCTACGSRPPRSRRSGTTRASSTALACNRPTPGTSCSSTAETISDYGVAPLLDRSRRRAGPCPTCSRTSTCAPRARTCTTSSRRTRSRGPTSP